MSRIGESSDDERTRALADEAARQRSDANKRLDQERITRSFQEVMRDQGARDQSRRTQEQGAARQAAAARTDKPKDKTTEKRVADNAVAQGRNSARRQAMSTALGGQAQKTREKLSSEARALETDRNKEIVQRSDEEVDTRRADREVLDRGERNVEERRALNLATELKVDPDEHGKGQQRRDQGQEKGQREERPVEGLKAKEAQGAAGAARIPDQILEAIAKSVAMQISPDGRTELSITLKGTLLEGVTVHVTAKKGKVFCTFEGCDRQTGNLLESSRGELMRQLGKRGLELEGLRIK